MTAWEIDHLHDCRDNAQAFVTLDGREAALCEVCGQLSYQCRCCDLCGGLRPCPCDVPLSQREERAMRDRHGKAWRS